MNTLSPTPADVARLQQAGDWVQQLVEPHDQAVVDSWTEWCAADPRNRGAFESMQDVWDGFATAGPAAMPVPPPARTFPRRTAWLSLAAGVLCLVRAGGWLASRPAQIQEFRTIAGEQRIDTLLDGTSIDLAPNSRVFVRYTPLRREVRLEGGQVFFTVEHSVLRPFVVHADGVTVTAEGTAFDVRTSPSGTVVTVSQGRVNVTPATHGEATPSEITPQQVLAVAGQRLTFTPAAAQWTTAAVDPVAAEAWRRGVLPFVGEPLEEVVGEVNRYSVRKIEIAPGFAQTRFTGTVSLGHVEDWLHALPRIFSVEVIDRGSNEIQIRSRPANDVS